LARDNYSYNKYQKELARKKKKEEKMQSRLDKKNAQGQASPEQVSNGEATVV
jgi:hypothetical protein